MFARASARVAVSACCGVEAHVPGNATRERADSHSSPLGRCNCSKWHFCGTYACVHVRWNGILQSIESQSVQRVERVRQPTRYPTAPGAGRVADSPTSLLPDGAVACVPQGRVRYGSA